MDQQNTAMNLTADGLRLYNKVQRGAATLNLVRIVVGDGELAENETAYDLVALKRAVDAVTEIIKNEEIGDGTTRLTIRILSSVIDYYLREIGIIAIDPDEGEILYAYCNFGEYADYIRTFNGSVATTQEIDIYIQVGNAPNMIVNVTDALVVTPKDLREHTENQNNPHNVTAEQLGLKKALLDTITEQRLLNYDTAYKKSHIHANAAILDAITQAVIAGWNAGYTHSTTKGNPHNTSKSDIGLGNVTNESKKTMFNSPEFTGAPTAPTASTSTSDTQIATTKFVHDVLNKDYGNIYMTDKLDVVSASGMTYVTNRMGEKVSQLLNTVETTWGKAVHGKDYGTAYYSDTENVDLYIKLYFSDDVLYWDEYYYNPGGDAIYIGSECVIGHRGDDLISFNYENSAAGGADLVSLRDAVIYLLRKAGVGGR